jgi:O-antigen/teichoic acid export membrane protein
LFSPFVVRANHYIGQSDQKGLNAFVLQVATITAPLVFLPTCACAIVAKPFVLSWVGGLYSEGANLAKYGALFFAVSFISYTSSMLLIVKERIKEMYLIATIQPILFWLGVFLTTHYIGLFSFSIFKLSAIYLSEIFYLYILLKECKISIIDFSHKILYPMILPFLFVVISLLISTYYLPHSKSKINLLIVVVVTGISILGGYAIQYIMSKEIRITANNVLAHIIPAR